MLTSRKLCTFLCIALGIFSSIISYGTEYADALRNQAAVVDSFHGKPRVLVLTDIGNEPDDQMSLTRFLLYSNEFDIEGLVATTSTWQKATPIAPCGGRLKRYRKTQYKWLRLLCDSTNGSL